MLRMARPSDGPSLAALYAPYVTHGVESFEAKPPSGDELSRRVAATVPDHPWLVAEEGGQVAAYAYACPHRDRPAYRWSVEVSVYVRRDCQRQGHGRRLYATLLELLRRQGYRRAFAGITLPNPGSVGLHEAMGFEPVGVFPDVGFKFGAWRDVGWWTLALLPPIDNPPEPRALVPTDFP